MSYNKNYDDDYDDRILRIKGEFINFLRKDLKIGSDDEKVDQKEIRKSVYKFIFDRIADKGIEVIKGKNKNKKKVLFFKFFVNTVDFCLIYGEIIIDTLSELKRYKDFEELKIKNDSEIDA